MCKGESFEDNLYVLRIICTWQKEACFFPMAVDKKDNDRVGFFFFFFYCVYLTVIINKKKKKKFHLL